MVSIPFIGGGKKRTPNEVYIGIFFKEQEGAVMYLEDTNAGLKILGTEHFSYSNGWEQLVDDIDEVLYRLETKTHLAPQKAIFFVYSHFIDHEHKEIKRAFLAKIKEAAKSLDLKPLGYIECQEAIIEHFKAREHTPLHMILLEFDRTVVTLALYQGGHNIHEQTIARSGDVIDTLTPLLQDLKQQFVLPNRLILYDEKSLTNDVSTLLSNRWSEDIFPTPPKLDIMTQEDLHKSLVDVFARQIHAAPAVSDTVPTPNTVAAEEPSPTSVAAVGDDFLISDTAPLAQSNIKESPNEMMGFTIGDDESDDTDMADAPASKKKRFAVGNPLKALKLPSVRLPSAGKVFPAAGIILLLLVVGGLGAGEYLLHKAQVKVTFPSAPVTKTVTIDASIPLAEGSDSTQIQESAQTTGTRTVGEKAKGTVTIYNSSLQGRKSLSKGTELSGPNGLTFVLDDDVEVASASGDASQIKSSTAKVAALAGEIGTEYNVGAGAKLSVEGQSSSDIIAQADGAFTGGSKRQIRVASTNDIAKLRAAAAEKAKKDAAAGLTTKVGSGKVIVKDLTEVVLENEKLSRQAGAEAESVSLTANAKTTYYTYDESRLKNAFNKELGKGLPSGTQILPESVEFTISKLENKDEPKERVVTFNVKAKAVPRFDRASLTARVTGKQVAVLDKIVKDGFRATDAEVQNTPGIPPFTVFTPFIKKNITLDVSYQ